MILEMTRCLLHEKDLPKKFWVEAASTIVYLLNRLPTKALKKYTLFESWFSNQPKVMNLKTFSCLCFSFVPKVKRDKLDKQSEMRIFVRYSDTSKAYRIYLPQTNKIVVSKMSSFWKQRNGAGMKRCNNIKMKMLMSF